MRIGKISSLTIVLFALASCGQFVAKETLEASEQENRELKESLNKIQENYVKQNKELNAILAEISEITYQTTTLQLKVEQGTTQQQSVADKISDNIKALKKRIDRLENEAKKARGIDKSYAITVSTINTLRETIANQEAEIALLKETVNHQKDTIQNQRLDLERQYEMIVKQRNQLDETVRKQAELLYQAGLEFEKIADEGDFKITGRKNRTTVQEYRKHIYEKAKSFYRAAAEQDYADAAVRMAGVEAKLVGF